jgi:hypothetical protein
MGVGSNGLSSNGVNGVNGDAGHATTATEYVGPRGMLNRTELVRLLQQALGELGYDRCCPPPHTPAVLVETVAL